MINQALREYVMGQQLPIDDLIRRVVREELAQYKVDQGGSASATTR
jgi:hypothetical protein